MSSIAYYTEIATRTQFQKNMLERVHRVTIILEYLNHQSILKNSLALKGSGAINLTIFNLPRLTEGIELDFCLPVDRETMMEYRNIINQEIMVFLAAHDYRINSKTKTNKSRDSWILQYKNNEGHNDQVELKINYSHRNHIMNTERKPILTELFNNQFTTQALSVIEVFACKIADLLNSPNVIDLYDVNFMLNGVVIKQDHYDFLKKCIIFYLPIVSKSNVYNLDPAIINGIGKPSMVQELTPLMQKEKVFVLNSAKRRVRKFIKDLMILNEDEIKYLEKFKMGIYQPTLLFSREEIIDKIKFHPMALWKVEQNLKK